MNSVRSHAIRENASLVLAVLAVVLFDVHAALGGGLLKVYYVRHGEGGHNVVREWKDKPKDQWPSYVGNPNIFTPKGDSQVVALTGKLKGMSFDFIAASPMWRTRHTILPYLTAAGRTAEIWPELTETIHVHPDRITAANLPAASATLLQGAAIRIPADEAPFFTWRDSAKSEAKFGAGEVQETADAIALGKRAIALIKQRFAGTNTSILLVGHGNAGSTLLRLLTGVMDIHGLKNTMIWMAEEQPDGSFSLKMLNNEPFTVMQPVKRVLIK